MMFLPSITKLETLTRNRFTSNLSQNKIVVLKGTSMKN